MIEWKNSIKRTYGEEKGIQKYQTRGHNQRIKVREGRYKNAKTGKNKGKKGIEIGRGNISSLSSLKQSFLCRSPPYKICQVVSYFRFLDFETTVVYRARPSAFRAAHSLKDQISLYTYPTDRVTQL